MRWLINFYDSTFKWTATAAIGIHPTKADYHSWGISKMQSYTLEERNAIKLCFKLGKNATETYGMLQNAFGASCMNRESDFVWHKRFKEGMESVRDDERCGRSKEVNTRELIGKGLGLRLLCWGFKGVQLEILGKRPALFKSGQWHFHQDNIPVYNFILVTDYLTQDGHQDSSSASQLSRLAPCDLWLFP